MHEPGIALCVGIWWDGCLNIVMHTVNVIRKRILEAWSTWNGISKYTLGEGAPCHLWPPVLLRDRYSKDGEMGVVGAAVAAGVAAVAAAVRGE